MKKISVILVAAIASLLLCPVLAQARYSVYINSYAAKASKGDIQGTVNFDFSVRATKNVSKIGALKIEIHQANGGYITTIWGNTANGLLSSKNCQVYGYNYLHKGTPGMSYYAVITLCAGPATNYDTREVTTETVRAPY